MVLRPRPVALREVLDQLVAHQEHALSLNGAEAWQGTALQELQQTMRMKIERLGEHLDLLVDLDDQQSSCRQFSIRGRRGTPDPLQERLEIAWIDTLTIEVQVEPEQLLAPPNFAEQVVEVPKAPLDFEACGLLEACRSGELLRPVVVGKVIEYLFEHAATISDDSAAIDRFHRRTAQTLGGSIRSTVFARSIDLSNDATLPTPVLSAQATG